MPRLIAIDYGLKRCGIAETDDLMMIASPLETVATATIFEYLSKYLSKYKVEAIVVGEPMNNDGRATHGTAPAQAFCELLKKKFPDVLIERANEAFTSKMAMQTMVSGGMKKKDRQVKGNLDKIAAAIILQGYMSIRERNQRG